MRPLASQLVNENAGKSGWGTRGGLENVPKLSREACGKVEHRTALGLAQGMQIVCGDPPSPPFPPLPSSPLHTQPLTGANKRMNEAQLG